MASHKTYFLSSLAFAALSLAQDCTLTLPANPLSATGLATPFTLSGCDQTQFGDEGCFVEAGIIDTATGSITIYHPLVVNEGDVANKDFIPPIAATLPANALVALWFGSNGNTLTLAGDTTGCVNGLPGSIFGQVAYCNAPAFFTAAEKAVTAGQFSIPAPGEATKAKGQACLAGTRDFRMVDMDQSDNVVTTYLLINGTKLAQNTAANAAASKGNSEELSNGSDNALMNDFLQPALGCNTLEVDSPTAPSGKTSALVLNELISQFHPPQTPALVPLNDPMCVLADGSQSLDKVNAYRAGVGQPAAATEADADGTTYCKNFAAAGIFIQENAALFTGNPSPATAVASDLFTFMANRFANSFGPVPALGCETIFGLQDSPVAQASDSASVVTSASINTVVLQSILDGKITPVTTTAEAAGSTSSSTASRSRGRGGGKGKATTSSRASRTTASRGRVKATTTSTEAKATVTTSAGAGRGGHGGGKGKSTTSSLAAAATSTGAGRGGHGGGRGRTTTSSLAAVTASSSEEAAVTSTSASTGGNGGAKQVSHGGHTRSRSRSACSTVTRIFTA